MRLEAMKRRPLIVPPSAGWIPKSYYHVECAVDWSNVVHPAIFYSGFLEPDGTPGSYAGILTHGEETYYSELSYLRAVRLLLTDEEFRKTPTDGCVSALDLWKARDEFLQECSLCHDFFSPSGIRFDGINWSCEKCDRTLDVLSLLADPKLQA